MRIRWPSLAAYYAELSPNLRSSLSRLSRRLSETGCTEVVSSRDPACLPALFELYLEVEERSWKANVGAGVCRSPLRENYMRELMRNRRLLEVDIKILLLEGVAISGIMTGAFGNSRYLLQLSYDAALAKLGPGSPMLALCVRDSLLEGRTEFNFLNGFAFYKTRWLADVTPTRIMQIYRRGSLPDWRRRAGITDALHHLQALQAVVQRRGGVQVMEAAALGQAACACHARMDARYERIFAHTSPPSDMLSSFIFHNIENFRH